MPHHAQLHAVSRKRTRAQRRVFEKAKTGGGKDPRSKCWPCQDTTRQPHTKRSRRTQLQAVGVRHAATGRRQRHSRHGSRSPLKSSFVLTPRNRGLHRRITKIGSRNGREALWTMRGQGDGGRRSQMERNDEARPCRTLALWHEVLWSGLFQRQARRWGWSEPAGAAGGRLTAGHLGRRHGCWRAAEGGGRETDDRCHRPLTAAFWNQNVVFGAHALNAAGPPWLLRTNAHSMARWRACAHNARRQA